MPMKLRSPFLSLVGLFFIVFLARGIAKGDTVGIYKCTEVRSAKVYGVTDSQVPTSAKRSQRSRRTFFVVRSIEQPSTPIIVIDYGRESEGKFYNQSTESLGGAQNIFINARKVFQGVDYAESFSFNADGIGGNDSLYVDTRYLRSRLRPFRVPRVGINFQYVPRVLTSRFLMSEDRTRVENDSGGFEAGDEYRFGNGNSRWTLSVGMTAKANDAEAANINGEAPGTLEFGAEIVKQFLEARNYVEN